MASDFPNSADQMETASTNHLRELPSSYSEAPVLPSSMMVCMNYPPSESSQEQRMDAPSVEASDNVLEQKEGSLNDGFSAWRNATDQVFLMHQVNDPSSIIQRTQNIRCQGLSLSLGTEVSSGLVRSSDSHLMFLGLNMVKSSDDVKQDSMTREPEKPGGKEAQNAESAQGDFHCEDQDEATMDLSPRELSGTEMTIPTSKYLKAVQELLNEVVTAKKVLEQPRSEKMKDIREHGEESKQAGESKDLASAEMQDLQAKQMKLLTMLDEINLRYKQYRNHMQILETSFDSVAGYGAARDYTALALQAMSRHFRCLCDVINGQIRAIQNSLGEQDGIESEGVKIPRLRYVDQQLKQQKVLQELGVLQPHTWRPQRGLPESSVSVLRAWLFEHFLHPYPKDSDKMMLARQAELSRSQVSNWFINARVRLWKPMIEEMYKNEIDSGEMNSPPENATGETESELEASDLQQCASSASKPTDIADFEIQKRCGEEPENKDLKSSAELGYVTDDSTYFPGPSLQLGLQHHESFDAATAEASSGTVSFQFLSTEHQQHLFGSPYLLHDFVG